MYIIYTGKENKPFIHLFYKFKYPKFYKLRISRPITINVIILNDGITYDNEWFDDG